MLAALIVAGCATSSQNPGEKPVKHAGRVKAAIYNSVERTPTTHLDVYSNPQSVERLHKVIALLTCEGAAHEEGELVNAINYKARQLGAHGVVVIPPDRPNEGLVIAHPWFQPADRRVFRANAIVYTDTTQ